MKYLLYQTEMLTDVRMGIYTCWSYWSDGSITEEKIPKGMVFMPTTLAVY